MNHVQKCNVRAIVATRNSTPFCLATQTAYYSVVTPEPHGPQHRQCDRSASSASLVLKVPRSRGCLRYLKLSASRREGGLPEEGSGSGDPQSHHCPDFAELGMMYALCDMLTR